MNDPTMYLAIVGNVLLIISEILPFIPCAANGICDFVVSKFYPNRIKIKPDEHNIQVLNEQITDMKNKISLNDFTHKEEIEKMRKKIWNMNKKYKTIVKENEKFINKIGEVETQIRHKKNISSEEIIQNLDELNSVVKKQLDLFNHEEIILE